MDQSPKRPARGKAPINAYQRTGVMTASKENILLMLYAGAIRFLKLAIEAGEKGDIPEKGRLLMRVQEIVTELRSTLNFEVGGDIAERLDTLYGFISERLVKSGLASDSKGLRDALDVLETLNSGWEEAVASLKREKTAASPEK